jgi:hypothetical protein
LSPVALGTLLALGAAVALNGSYLLQHAGSPKAVTVSARRPLRTLGALLRSPLWSLGAVAGFTGWGLHIGAMREAPLSLVQAFVAGGLALAAPMAALGLRRRLAPGELQGLGLLVVALLLLALGMPSGSAVGFSGTRLALCTAALAGLAAVLALRGGRRAGALGTAGGLLYGTADLALKAVTQSHLDPWLAVALLATAGAFFAFQRGLQADGPLPVIAAMTAATNVSSIACSFVVFGDPLGRTPTLAALHALAFGLVVAGAWRLAPVQARLAVAA